MWLSVNGMSILNQIAICLIKMQDVTECKYSIRTDINRDGTEIVAFFYL